MVTLDRWRPYASAPRTIVFPKLELIGRDYSPPIVVGGGEVRMETLSGFTFRLTGTPTDIGYAFAELRRLRENPYDGLARLRLQGVDSDGTEWAGGYTDPMIDMTENAWTFTGQINSLSTDDQSSPVPQQASTELMFPLRVGDLMTLAVSGLPTLNPPGTNPRREHKIEVLGSTIRFAYDHAAGMFFITATHSADLPATYAENWLTEPLRIIFGQLIFPRLVARNLGGGRAIVHIGRVPNLIPGARWAALLDAAQLYSNNGEVWTLYGQLLTLIARARGHDGSLTFSPHKITRLYEEIVQAALGSRWVWALTFASSIEAIARMLKPTNTTSSNADANAIAEFAKYIKLWPSDPDLKRAAINAAHRTANFTTIRILRALSDDGVITESELSVWKSIRDEVMHGKLISPYSSEEDDGELVSLSTMMHRLTREVLRRSV